MMQLIWQLRALVMFSNKKPYVLSTFPTQGQAYVNGFNIGRYWPVLGPQIAMYVPATALSRAGYNMNSKLVLFEVDNAPCQSTEKCYVEFLDRPLINGAVHPMKGEVEMFQDWTAKYADDDVLGKSGLNLNIEE